MNRLKPHKGLVMVTALMLLLTLSSVSLLRLNSLISEVGTIRYYRIDALVSDYTMGGANATLSLAIKNPAGFDGYLQRHNFTITNTEISNYFTKLNNDNTSVYAPDRYNGTFTTVSSAPENAGSVPGFAMGKYCMKKYYLTITGTLQQSGSTDSYVKTASGILLIGPLVCE